jgi:hypothetical protein
MDWAWGKGAGAVSKRRSTPGRPWWNALQWRFLSQLIPSSWRTYCLREVNNSTPPFTSKSTGFSVEISWALGMTSHGEAKHYPDPRLAEPAGISDDTLGSWNLKLSPLWTVYFLTFSETICSWWCLCGKQRREIRCPPLQLAKSEQAYA